MSSQALLIDSSPTLNGEDKDTEMYSNAKAFLLRSYLETIGLFIGTLGAVIITLKYK